MIQIFMAVSDDESSVCDSISEYTKELAQRSGFIAVVDKFSSGSELLCDDWQKYKMIFLDIETEGKNGLETAEVLRKDGYQGEIVFISAIPEYCSRGYRYKAYRFLIKPISYDDFSFELKDAFAYLKKREELSKKLAGRTKKIIPAYQDIFFIEVMNHTILYHEEKKTIEKTGSMRELEKDYLPLGFCRIHQSYLINMEKISEFYSGKVVLENKIILPVSRSREKQFMERYASFCMERM
ncbi:MAG: response regulator transcription factor [Lachnospiraceae bacterium]|nr:response regulator transcription factor [Lachnospiraceae bacterium]